MNMSSVNSEMSTSKHPQTDDSTEITNLMVANFLRCNCKYHQASLTHLLPAAEYANNSTDIDSIEISPLKTGLKSYPASLRAIVSKSKNQTFGAPLTSRLDSRHLCMTLYLH